MRVRSIHLLLFIMLALPGWAHAQQGVAANGKNTESKNATTAPATAKENWGVLDDLKTGLEPTAFVDVQSDEQPGFTRQLIRVQWRMNDPVDLWVARPKVTGKVPVVLYLYSYTDVNDRFHDNGWCERATAGGFAAVGFVSALTDYRYRARPMKQWFVSELAESLGSSVHDVQLILNYLADRGDMDMDHVGMFGMGSGAAPYTPRYCAAVDSRMTQTTSRPRALAEEGSQIGASQNFLLVIAAASSAAIAASSFSPFSALAVEASPMTPSGERLARLRQR